MRLLVHINKILEKKAIMVESEHYNDINNCQPSVRALPTNSCYKSSLFSVRRDRYAVLRTFEYFAIKAINQKYIYEYIFPCATLLIFWSSALQTDMSFNLVKPPTYLYFPPTLCKHIILAGGESLLWQSPPH